MVLDSTLFKSYVQLIAKEGICIISYYYHWGGCIKYE